MQSHLEPSDAEIEMAKVVEFIFTQIKLICPGWKATWSNESVENEAKKFWLKVLLETDIRTDFEIKCGLQRTLKEGDPYCPPIGRFIRWCKPNPEVLGLPSASAAYREACQKVHPARQQTVWSHAAVFLAAQSVGAHELRILSQDKSWPVFERAYAIACDRVLAGEDLSEKIPRALPERVSGRPAPTEVAREHLKFLKKMVQ